MRVVEIGIERGGGLVHEDHVRLDGERARDAQPLLLAARQAQRAVLQPVLHLVPERRVVQSAFSTRSSRLPFIPSTRGPKAMLS